MERLWKSVGVGAVLWTVAVALAVMGSVTGELMLMAWAVIVGMVASLVVVWVISFRATCIACAQERLSIEHLAEIMAAAALDAGVTKLRH